MKEDFLHYIWKYQLFHSTELKLVNGELIQVLQVGTLNFDSGPDFFNAKIKIGNTIWAGNVEIHINSSDWIKHNHHNNKAYNNVILHIVYNNDKPIYDAKKNEIATLELKPLINENLINRYDDLVSSKSWVPCQNLIQSIEEFTINSWLDRLIIERLERKASDIEETLKQNQSDWEETFYQYLFKYFGLKVNEEPFFQLARNTPLKIVEKHNSLVAIEALFYGQAGFLLSNIEDKYFKDLQQEYKFLKAKFELTAMDVSMWKFMRLRPPNFPTIRISQLANLLCNHPRLFAQTIEAKVINEIYGLFNVSASNYWENHYTFGNLINQNSVKSLGKTTINNIIINVIVPFTFVYGKAKNDELLVEKALNYLELLKPESNSIVENWKNLGLKISNAMHTQSLIELKNNYCSHKKCLNCNIGSKILQQ